MPLLSREVQPALAPHRLLPGICGLPGVRALDAGAPEGWGSPPGHASPVFSLLAIEPEVEFRGGFAALCDALSWLDPQGCRRRVGRWLIGHLGYGLGASFERLPAPRTADPPTPEVCLGAYRAVYVFDPERRRASVLGEDAEAVGRLEARVRAATHAAKGAPPLRLPEPRPVTPDADFLAGVGTIQEWIRAGDVYQVNLSRRLHLEPVPEDALPSLYATLACLAPAPFGAFLDGGDHVVLSNSPERFLRVTGDRVETCPIKGTRPRGETPEEDSWLAKELVHSPKDRAEHVMIVDLERNDLGRVCRTGTVSVERLAALRTYATVHHLVSSIQGSLQRSGNVLGLLAATFPGGSITGAPKIRAVEIIDSLEPVGRGVYTGAIGWIDGQGDLDLSIAIRTAVGARGRLALHVGGGIVADSDPQAELQETRDKAAAFSRLCSGAP